MRILIVDAHPDPDPARYGHALTEAYRVGAAESGHQTRLLRLANLDFPLLRTAAAWDRDPPPAPIKTAQDDFAWAEHLVFVYPLWLGSMPALLKAFLEQVCRPGFAIAREARSLDAGLLKGRSARVIITMGMPAFIYRWFFFAHSLHSFERNILRFVGVRPVRSTIIGSVAAADGSARAAWLDKVRALGRSGR